MQDLSYEIIRRPIVTEKTNVLNGISKVVFEVAKSANKASIKTAVESLFKVKVTGVNVINVLGKRKNVRGMKGKKSDYKKAIVTVAEGQSVDVMAGVK